MEHFDKKDEQKFKELVSNKLVDSNFEFYFYNTLIDIIPFNRGYFIEQNNEWLVGVELSKGDINQILVYSNSSDKVFLDNIFDFINIETSFQGVMGSYIVVSHILNKYPNVFEVFNDRIFYEIDKKDFIPFQSTSLYIMGIDNYLEEVTEMKCDFSKEEWKGKNPKNYDVYIKEIKEKYDRCQMSFAIALDIKKNIIGYCELNSEDMIGTIFIKDKYRNYKYGKTMTSEITKELLKNSSKLKLMTKVENEPMIKILKQLGYKEVCKHLDILKK